VIRPQLNAEDIIRILNRHDVEYVIIGAFAAIAQGAPIDATYDVDVTPRRNAENLSRLRRTARTSCWNPGRRRRRGPPVRSRRGVPHAHGDAQPTCAAGDFDLVFNPAAAPNGYDDLVGQAIVVAIGHQEARVACWLM
jgi:hypothetical protein